MDDKGIEFRLVVGHALRTIEGFVVAEEGDDGVGLQVGEPLIGGGEESIARMRGVLRAEFFRTREGPLRLAGGMGTKTRGVSGASHIADDELFVGIAEV